MAVGSRRQPSDAWWPCGSGCTSGNLQLISCCLDQLQHKERQIRDYRCSVFSTWVTRVTYGITACCSLILISQIKRQKERKKKHSWRDILSSRRHVRAEGKSEEERSSLGAYCEKIQTEMQLFSYQMVGVWLIVGGAKVCSC